MYADRPECDFTSYKPVMTQCFNCTQLVPKLFAVKKEYFTDGFKHIASFCCTECKNDWYLKHLNEAGM